MLRQKVEIQVVYRGILVSICDDLSYFIPHFARRPRIAIACLLTRIQAEKEEFQGKIVKNYILFDLILKSF